MTARIASVADVRRHGDNLTIVTIRNGDETQEVVANLQDDGTPRWAAGETLVYVSEGSIVPDDVLQERGYWNDDKGIGLLEGKKGNRVKMRRFAGFESRGLLFKTRAGQADGEVLVDRYGRDPIAASLGDDVTEHLGIVEHGA